MATQTQTIRKVPVQPGRAHDYLYDKIHILASERDHARATFKAHTSTSHVKQLPIYRSMFSELKNFPRFQMRLDVKDPVPTFINRQWPGYSNQNREALLRYTTFNYTPYLRVPGVKYDDGQVTGANRYKYFRRPIIPFMQQVQPDVVLATARSDTFAAQDTFVHRPVTPLTRTVHVQTDYRDGEAQTEPYTPEYVIRPGEQPELLTLATLIYGRGLPAGLAEVEMIERARAKRAWEATLPPLNDMSQSDKRRKMMDDMETKEWAFREHEIEKLQEARLEVLKDLLRQREINQQNLNIRRLDKVWSKKQEDKERKVKQIRKEHIREIRKLLKRRGMVESKFQRSDIVHELSDAGSQAYAPLTRLGVFIDRGSEQYVVKSKYLSSYQGLLELEASLPSFVLNPRIKAPKPQSTTKAGFLRRKQRQEVEMAELYHILKEMKNKDLEAQKPLRYLQKIEKPSPRPPTPSVEVPPEEEEEQELAVIFLQKIIRGRAIQNMMFEGKEKRTELIKELRSTHALQEAEQLIKKQEKQATLALQRQRRLHDHKESVVDGVLAELEGGSVGSLLDFLNKELIRLQEERRIHAFAMLAERQRRLREAEESGRRQVEERRRREHDEIFKQMIKVHQVTVDTYLENIILDAVDSTAEEQARVEVRQMAAKINDVAYRIEMSRSRLESEEIVSELIHCFLLPEAQKATVRERIARQQRKYLLAAHNEIHKDAEDVIDQFKDPNIKDESQTSVARSPTGSVTSAVCTPPLRDIEQADQLERHTSTTSDQLERRTSTTSDQLERRTSTTSDQPERRTSSTSDQLERHTSTTSGQPERRTSSTSDQLERRTSTSDQQQRRISTSDQLERRTSSTSDQLERRTSSTSDQLERRTSLGAERTASVHESPEQSHPASPKSDTKIEDGSRSQSKAATPTASKPGSPHEFGGSEQSGKTSPPQD